MFRALSLYREKVEKLSRPQQFMQLMNLYIGARYEMGKENLEVADCSGLICGTLTLMGNEIRINAQDIRALLAVPDNSVYDKNKVKLMFFIDESGTAKHVAVVCQNGLLFHSSHPNGALYESEGIVMDRYNKRGMKAEVRMLDFTKVDEHTGTIYDLDAELS